MTDQQLTRCIDVVAGMLYGGLVVGVVTMWLDGWSQGLGIIFGLIIVFISLAPWECDTTEELGWRRVDDDKWG